MKSYTYKQIISISLCIAIILMMSMFLCVQFFNNSIVSAEESSEIVNFNQYVSNSLINSSGSNQNITIKSDLILQHKYYIRVNITSVSSGQTSGFYFSNDAITSYNLIFSISSVGYYSNIVTSSYYNFKIKCVGNLVWNNLQLIDLTQMGIEDYTLQQCEDLFIAPYYSYTSGTYIYLNNLDSYSNGYTNGFNDAWDSQDITYNSFMIGVNAFTYSNDVISVGTPLVGLDSLTGYYVFGGCIGVPIGLVLERGTTIEVDFYFWIDNAGTDYTPTERLQYFKLCFGYVDSNNNLVDISTITASENTDGGGRGFRYTGTFVLPVDTDTIYCHTNYYADSIVVYRSDMSFRTNNIQSALYSAFTRGQDSVVNQYNEYYSPGGVGYYNIYMQGYNSYPGEDHYTFAKFITAVIDTPVKAFINLFDFNILGINMKTLYASLLTLCVIVSILRLVL